MHMCIRTESNTLRNIPHLFDSLLIKNKLLLRIMFTKGLRFQKLFLQGSISESNIVLNRQNIYLLIDINFKSIFCLVDGDMQ